MASSAGPEPLSPSAAPLAALSLEPAPEPTPEPAPETRAGVLLLRSWLGRIVRVRLSDGRTVAGTLRCIDRDSNLILGSANERFGGRGPPQTIGHVMVPGKHIVQLWVENLDMN